MREGPVLRKQTFSMSLPTCLCTLSFIKIIVVILIWMVQLKVYSIALIKSVHLNQ